jgi:hypothetical protein
MKIGLAPLSRWINASLMQEKAVVRARLASDDADVLELVESCGIFVAQGSLQEVACTQCDEPHASPVFRSQEGQVGHYCLKNGWIPLTPEQIALVAFDPAALLRGLASGVGLPWNKSRFYADGRLVYLGIVDSDSRAPWVLGYADQLEDTNVQASAIEELAERFPGGPGLIATPSPVPLNMPLPRGFKLAALHELFAAVADGIVLDAAHAETRLDMRRKVPGVPGRPTERGMIRQIWMKGRHAPDWPQSRQAQADYILNKWPDEAVSRPRPKTIINHLATFEREELSGQ